MPCTICYDSLFKATTAASADSRPKALSCGHVYHGHCIKRFFDTSLQSVCPTCRCLHVGALLTLYINVDEGDVPAGERPRIRATSDAAKNQAVVESGNREGNTADEAGGSGDQIENSVNEEDVCRLSGQVATLTTELFSRVEQIRELTRDVEEEMRKNRVFEASLRSQLVMIYQQEEDIREKDDIIESLDFDVDRLEKQAGGHLGNIRGLRRKVDALNARIANTDALQRKADWMQSEINRLEQLPIQYSESNDGLVLAVQELSARIEALEAENSRLNRLSVAHKTHITSLQRALDSERAITNGDNGCECDIDYGCDRYLCDCFCHDNDNWW